MRTIRTRQLLAVLAALFAVVLLGAAPASAGVDCADLRTQRAAQSYFEGPAGASSGLDADGDGQACEGNTPTSDGKWTLLGLGGVIAAVLLGNWMMAKRRTQPRPAAGPDPVWAPVGATRRVLAAAPAGSLAELARALRRVPHGERMPLLEEHARSHGSSPQDVLDALVAQVTDLALQRWALAGYGPPSHVRMMFCPCAAAPR
ncbi:MAG: excalibur calcium-binding domain-containing protein, partial [Marmoricola sp.]